MDFERRFQKDCCRHESRKTNVVSENKNENVEMIIKDVDIIRKEILAKFVWVKGMHGSQTG